MLEKMDKKTKNKHMEKEESNTNLQGIIEIKKTKKEDESFQRTTLTHQMEKMKDDIFNIKKEINLCETDTSRLNKLFDKERIKENKQSIKRWVTLSPKTEMARVFHHKNGAFTLQENLETINYEYQ